MPHIANRSRGAAAITPFILSLACLWLGACGGSYRPRKGRGREHALHHHCKHAAAEHLHHPRRHQHHRTAESGPPTAADEHRRQVALRVVKCFHADGVSLPEPTPQGYITSPPPAQTFKKVCRSANRS